ncbi:MAG TPA: transglycosylase SLT domain-containing protein [Gallionellaceae bacterium]|nr:transglycosylase SLT domain-containing protein [Gallionellaceae bacterium]
MTKNNQFSFGFRAALALLVAAFPTTGLAQDATAGSMLAMDSHLSISFAETPPSILSQPRARKDDDKVQLTLDGRLPQSSLWQRIRNGFGMAELDSPLVARQERFFSSQPDYLARMSDRARLYLYFIVREVQRRGMPTEIALLPMIESAFNPTAYSVANASGIWQFIPSTGRHYGMKQNWWHDGRRDVISATNGALDYLQALHDEFGDWQLALAAYNCGERCVEHAQRRNRRYHRPTDFAHLRLPRETRNYVPKLIAMKHIISDPAAFGISLNEIPNQPYFAAIIPSHHIDVSLAAQMAGMSLDDFKALNPGNSRPVILNDDSTRILIPAANADQFEANLEHHDEPLVTWQAYQSRKGESLAKLAARFSIPEEKLRKANGLLPGTRVANGQKLLVPATNDDPNHEFEAFNMHLAPTLGDGHALIHIVRHGESLSVIAHHYHISVAALKRRNHGRTLIRPGQRLIIAGGGYVGHHYRRHHHHRARVARKSRGRATSVSSISHSGRDS